MVGLIYKSLPRVKNLTDFVKCHISANEMATHVNLNKKYKYIKLKKLFLKKNWKEKMGGC